MFPTHGILVEPSLRSDDQREYHDGVPRAHGIPRHDRAMPATFIAGNGREGATGSNHFVFVEDSGVFGVGKASVNDNLSYACKSFNERGLDIHEQEVQSDIVTCLGNQLHCLDHSTDFASHIAVHFDTSMICSTN